MATDRLSSSDLAVVVATRNRHDNLRSALHNLINVSGATKIIVVDNGSTDGSPSMVRQEYPEVQVIELPENIGAAARNVGVEATGRPYVAFSDDDSWWAPGALDRAASLLDAHPRLGVLQGRILVGEHDKVDPVCNEMARSPIEREDDLPGPSIIGFVACGAVVRTKAFLGVGGFSARYGVGGEESPCALMMVTSGYGLAYVDDVIAHHHPSPVRDHAARAVTEIRNDLWTAWRHLSLRCALTHTAGVVCRAVSFAPARKALIAAARQAPGVLRERKLASAKARQQMMVASSAG